MSFQLSDQNSPGREGNEGRGSHFDLAVSGTEPGTGAADVTALVSRDIYGFAIGARARLDLSA